MLPRPAFGVPAVHLGTNGWEPPARLLADLPRLMEIAAVPGVAIAAVEGDDVVWEGGFGLKNQAADDPVTPDTLFEVASLGKPLFAYLVLALRDRRLLGLDWPLVDYLPEPDFDNPFERQVTARHILTHSAGFPNWRSDPVPLELNRPPGGRFAYSGEGFFYLQRVVETVTDRPIEPLVRELVLGPLGLERSTFVWTPEVSYGMADGHLGLTRPLPTENYGILGRALDHVARRWGRPIAGWRYDDMVRAIPEADPAWPLLPKYMMPNVAGSLLSSAREYARFLAAMGAADSRDGVLSPVSRREMLTPAVRVNSAMAWGLGWGIERDNGRTAFWHWGNNDVYRAFAIGEPASRRALVVLTNSSNGHKLYARIVRECTGRELAALLWFRT